MLDDSIRDFSGFNARTIYEKHNLSLNRIDILSIDNFFMHTDFARCMILKTKRSGIILNFTMDVDPGYKYFEKFRGGVQWYMMESKNIFSSIFFKLKKIIN